MAHVVHLVLMTDLFSADLSLRHVNSRGALSLPRLDTERPRAPSPVSSSPPYFRWTPSSDSSTLTRGWRGTCCAHRGSHFTMRNSGRLAFSSIHSSLHLRFHVFTCPLASKRRTLSLQNTRASGNAVRFGCLCHPQLHPHIVLADFLPRSPHARCTAGPLTRPTGVAPGAPGLPAQRPSLTSLCRCHLVWRDLLLCPPPTYPPTHTRTHPPPFFIFRPACPASPRLSPPFSFARRAFFPPLGFCCGLQRLVGGVEYGRPLATGWTGTAGLTWCVALAALKFKLTFFRSPAGLLPSPFIFNGARFMIFCRQRIGLRSEHGLALTADAYGAPLTLSGEVRPAIAVPSCRFFPFLFYPPRCLGPSHSILFKLAFSVPPGRTIAQPYDNAAVLLARAVHSGSDAQFVFSAEQASFPYPFP